MAKKIKDFKKQVIAELKKKFQNYEEFISLISDSDLIYAVKNNFSVDSFIFTLVY